MAREAGDEAAWRSCRDGAVYASWNGATDVARWQALAAGKAVATAARTGFETRIALRAGAAVRRPGARRARATSWRPWRRREQPPNLVLLITDQQRAPQHWPDDPGWLDELMPNDAELRRTGHELQPGVHRDARCARRAARASSPGTYPSRHGVTLTLTDGDL